MTTEQTSLDIGIGTEEATTLKPATVSIKRVEIVKVGEKGNEILYTYVKHPEKEEEIRISEVKYLGHDEKLRTSAMWINKDSQGLLKKGSACVALLNFVGVASPAQLVDKEIATVLDDSGFLAYKAY